MNILILGGGLQGLSCGASLREKGYVVDIVSDELDIKRSKFFRKVFAVHSINAQYLQEQILRVEYYDIIIPISDNSVSLLSKNKSQIEQEYETVCACPDYNLFSVVEDKHKFMSFCDDFDIPHPKTIVLNSDNLQESSDYIGFPSLIKPDYSVGARGITRVNNYLELKSKYPITSNTFGSCTLQEYIDNDDYYYNVMLYRDKNGNFLGHTIIKILRKYPIDAGSSSYCVSVENNELLELCKDCLNKLNWIGMADFDVLQRLDNNEYRIIEINARVPASLRAASISGVNFPEIIVRDALGENVDTYNYMPGKALRYIGIDIMWFLKSPNRFRSRPSWFKFLGKQLYYQDIYANDISTWWTWLICGISKLTKRNKRIR